MRLATLAALALPALAAAQAPPPMADVQSLDEVRAAAVAAVRARIAGAPGHVIVAAAPLDVRLRLARCGGRLQTSLAGDALRDRTVVGVSCRDGTAWSIYVPVTVESEVPVLVARQPAARGAALTAADVTVEVRRVRGIGSAWLADPAALSGRLLRRPVAAGEALAADSFLAAPVIRRGQQVTLVASTGGIEVRALGRALADGAADSRVRVQNLASQKVVEGVVAGPDVIRVSP